MRHQAIVKHVPGEDRFTFSFIYTPHQTTGAGPGTGAGSKAGRQFNMNRGLDEAVDQFTLRVQANVGKTLNKKKKKKTEDIKVDVKFCSQDGENVSDVVTAGDLVKKSGLKESGV